MQYINIAYVEKTVRIVITVLSGYFFSQILTRSSGLFFDNIARRSSKITYKSRIHTLKAISNVIIRIILILIMILLIASDLGFNIIPILTGASILGVALSFGSQKLVQDMIAGFFLIIDNIINVGDIVKIGEIKGRVEQIMVRKVVIRDANNNLVYIPTSEIKDIKVYSQL